jgi:hypothetical protein
MCNCLKQLLLDAINDQYILVLCHHTLHYANMMPLQILNHLITTNDEIMPETLKANCNKLSANWNPNDGIEQLFTHITNAQAFTATQGAAHEIMDATTMFLILTAIQCTSMFDSLCSKWHGCPITKQTLDQFRMDFTHAWKECNCKMTAKSTSYHQANSAVTTKEKISGEKDSKKPDVCISTMEMYYCWLHGLGFNSNHMSSTCKTKKEGHKDNATIKNCMHGSTSIWANNFGHNTNCSDNNCSDTNRSSE